MRRLANLAARGGVVAVALGITGTALAASAGAQPASPTVGHAYVNGNTAGSNTIDVLDRHADGSLTPTVGSPVAAGGAGLGSGLASQGAIQASPDGRYLLAVDAGSNQISVLRIGADGLPALVGDPVDSGGVQPVSIAVSARWIVYVANVGAGGSSYTGFRLNRAGALIRIPHSTVAVPDGSGVADVFFNSTGDRLVGTRVNTSLIDSFTVSPAGRLTAAPGSPFPAQSVGPFGSEFRPTDPGELYVSNAHAGAGNGTVSAFSDGVDGTLSSIGDSPYPDFQTAPCWVEITSDGRYLFTVNTASGSVSRYAINEDGTLSLIGSTPFRDGAGAIDARLSPDGQTLSVTGSSSHVVSTFAVSGGNLIELPSSPVALPAGGAPSGLVVL
jgi:6-phosphogluconolactonase (cycloisomerase 2 family)